MLTKKLTILILFWVFLGSQEQHMLTKMTKPSNVGGIRQGPCRRKEFIQPFMKSNKSLSLLTCFILLYVNHTNSVVLSRYLAALVN